MDINAKKIEVIKHIIFIQYIGLINKIVRFLHGLDYGEEEKNLKSLARVVQEERILSVLNKGSSEYV